QHHVQCPAICELCRGANEDAWHVLFDCEESKNCWNVAGLQSVITARLQQFQDVKDVLFDICSKETKEVAGRVAMIIWLIWNNRNQWIWNHERRNATQLGVQASYMWNEWYGVQKFNNSIRLEEQVQQQLHWLPPRQGWLKCNVDAGFHDDGRITSGGWCFRNDRGQFVRAGTYWKRGAHSILEAEALALLEAIKVACTMNLEHISFESDSQLVVGAIHAANYNGASSFSILISNI
ncbi:ribonuclease H protein, partial [Trifolium medium]|nr:ribonuclease H protein [Trifolium medium]